MTNTKRVTDRRAVRFETFDELRADVASLAAADAAGTLRSTGNWTLGQALGHLAAWADYPYDGYPMKPIPFLLRWIRPILKRKFVHGRQTPGTRVPGSPPAGTWGTDVLPTAEGGERLKRALDRLERQAPTEPNPAFGRLTHDEWKRLHLNHAELHLSFFHA